jgi:small subunit ribosomal protein S7
MGQKNNILMVNPFQQKIFMNLENESSNIFKKFLQSLIKKGKKKKAQSVILKVIQLVQMMQPTKLKEEVFTQAVKNVQPSFEFKRARIGGLYQMIPGAKKPEKQSNLAVRWLLTLAKEKQKKSKTLKNQSYGIEFFLAQEIVSAYKNESELKQKKVEIHKLAETNRALAVQRWW